MSRRLAVFSSVFMSVVMLALVFGPARPAAAIFGLSPSISSVSPQLVPGVPNQKLIIKGDDFGSGADVIIEPATGLTMGPVEHISANELRVPVAVATDAPQTARDLTVTGGLGATAVCEDCVKIGPDITGITTGPLSNAGSTGTFTITGHAFKPSASINISRTGYGFNAAESDSANGTNLSITATSITATVTTLNKAPGRWKITVVQDGSSTTFGDGAATGLEITGGQPTITSLTPSRINPGESNKSITVGGSGFARGMTVTVSGTGVVQSAATSVTNANSAVIKLTAASNALVGIRNLVLRNADNQVSSAASLGVGQDVPPPPPPTISTLTPNVVGQGADKAPLVIAGTNFGPTPAVTFAPDTGITVNSIRRDSSAQLTVLVSTAADAPTTARSLTVANGINQAVKSDALTVSSAFGVTGLTPPGRPQGYTGTFVVNGSGFAGTPLVSMSPGTGVTVGNVVRDSAAKLTVNVTVAGSAPLSTHNVTVTNGSTPAGSPITCVGCFTVGKVPSVTSIAPTSGNGNGPVSISSIVGADFKPNPIVTLEKSGQPAIVMTDVTQTSTTLSGTFDLVNAAPGKWSVKVTNVDGGAATLTDAFTVVLAAPSIPDTTDLGTVAQATPATTLHLTGANFAPGMTVTILEARGVTVTDVIRLSPTAADIKIATDDTATLGSRDIKVTNTDGQSGTCVSCFTVTQGNQKQFFGPGFTTYENFTGGAFVAAGNLDSARATVHRSSPAPNAGGGPHVLAVPHQSHNRSAQPNLVVASSPTGRASPVASGSPWPTSTATASEEIITGAGLGRRAARPGVPTQQRHCRCPNRSVRGFFAYDPGFPGGVWVGAG